MLSQYRYLEHIPRRAQDWGVHVGAPAELAETLRVDFDLALLFRDLATLRTDVEVFDDVDELHWRGPTPAFEEIGRRLDAAIVEKTTKRPSEKRSSSAGRSR